MERPRIKTRTPRSANVYVTLRDGKTMRAKCFTVSNATVEQIRRIIVHGIASEPSP